MAGLSESGHFSSLVNVGWRNATPMTGMPIDVISGDLVGRMGAKVLVQFYNS